MCKFHYFLLINLNWQILTILDFIETYNVSKIIHIGFRCDMEVWEKINYIIDEKKILKRDFVKKLLELEPKLKTTGEIPSEQTIYRYLNGQREIKVELIPYIAEVLGVQEGELFRFDIEYASDYNIRFSKDAREILELLQYVPKPTLEHVKNSFRRFKKEHEQVVREV